MASLKKRWNIVRKDETPNGVFWRKVGTLVEFSSGDMKLNMFMFPQEFHVFEDSEEAREARQQARNAQGGQNGKTKSKEADDTTW